MIETNEAYISLFSRQKFIELHNENKFDEIVKNTILPIHKELAKGIKIRSNNIKNSFPSRASGLDRYMANNQRRQRRF